jgi:ankyrin repeat protein
LQDNYNVLHIASMYSREDVVKLLLNKKGVDAYATGGVSLTFLNHYTNAYMII